jgi:hypothetical protein
MNGDAVPAKTTAIALGLGLTMVPSVTTGSVDGFLVVVVLSSLCGLLFVAHRRGWLGRSQLPQPQADVQPTGVMCPAPMPDVFVAAPVLAPFGAEVDEKLEPQDSASYPEPALRPDSLPARSRHGLDQRTPITWRSLLAPTAPRHAAPSPILVAVATGIYIMTTKFAVRPLPVRN